MKKQVTVLAAFALVCGASFSPAQTVSSTLTAGTTAGATAQSAVNSLNASQNPFLGSTAAPAPTGEVLDLTVLDAINRGLRTNLGLVLTQQGTVQARAALLRARSALLPTVEAAATETVEQLNLAALGLPPTAGFAPIVGPFTVFDARAALRQNLFDLQAARLFQAAGASNRAAQFTYQNARDLVVLVVGGAYLQAIAGAARVDAAQSQFDTAKALYDRAVNLKTAGVAPAIDVLRAQVEMQAQQQRLLAARNELAKQILTLVRTIGIAPGQQIRLADTIPFAPPPAITLNEALQQAWGARADYKSAQSLQRAAELQRKAAVAERIPTLGIATDYGDQGHTPGSSHGTFTAAAALRVPIFEGGRIKADIQQADAQLQQARAQTEDLRGRIEFEVRTAFLDMSSAFEQVQVAESAVNLAREQLAQAQDRFAAGVTNNIEVIQAQDALAASNENYIASLFAYNFSKLSLARAVGVAEEATKRYLGGK